jgi:hypothetical protein
MKFEQITDDNVYFETGESCSGGLKSSLEVMGLQEQKTFILPITKGPVFLLLKKLVPDCTCLLHIGCSEDNRSPSFEHTIKYRNKEHELLKFSYRRTVYLGICWKYDWFHDNNNNRDLNALAKSLSDPEEYFEEITFFLSVKDFKDKDFIRRAGLRMSFRDNQLYSIKDLGEIQETFRNRIKGFDGSILDLTNGPLKSEKDQHLNDLDSEEWNEMLKNHGINVHEFIEKTYNLFQDTTPQFEERMRMREPLF